MPDIFSSLLAQVKVPQELECDPDAPVVVVARAPKKGKGTRWGVKSAKIEAGSVRIETHLASFPLGLTKAELCEALGLDRPFLTSCIVAMQRGDNPRIITVLNLGPKGARYGVPANEGSTKEE